MFDDLQTFITLSTNIQEQVDLEMQQYFAMLTLTYLEGITKLSVLSKLVADWVRRSHEIIFETKQPTYFESPIPSPIKSMLHQTTELARNSSDQMNHQHKLPKMQSLPSMLAFGKSNPSEHHARVKRHIQLFISCFNALTDVLQGMIKNLQSDGEDPTESLLTMLQIVKTDY